MKFVGVENKWNLRTNSSSSDPYFLQQDNSLSIKLVILVAHLLAKLKNLFCDILLFGKENMNDSKNVHIFNVTAEYVLSAERFNFCFLE